MEDSRYSGIPYHVLMKGSAVGRLNAPWRRVLHLAQRKSIRKGQSIDIRTSLSGPDGRPYFYYVVSGKIRLSYVSRNGEERTILYAGPDTLMNVPSVLVGDEDNTLVTCTEDAEVALFDSALLSDEDFASQYPDLMINLVHSLSVHMVIHSQRLAEASLSNSVAQVCRIILELSDRHGGRARFSPEMTQQELALLLGMHRTTLTRILCRLREGGVLGRFTRHDLEILDRARLVEMAESS
ncbi:Crp/Fnr family transcriptional regulator [Mailhella massiliensis]|uniref:Crp/Fnr family transcriptional regulator n=1 Tax=Mailhella massiliensis TaxID=1903261 RepID=UPI002357DD00|nr:Crp/Fnr family transcriptional regulator [Mailhella massiliensis]